MYQLLGLFLEPPASRKAISYPSPRLLHKSFPKLHMTYLVTSLSDSLSIFSDLPDSEAPPFGVPLRVRSTGDDGIGVEETVSPETVEMMTEPFGSVRFLLCRLLET